MLDHLRRGAALTKGSHGDDLPIKPDVVAPTAGATHLHRNAGTHGRQKHGVAICLRLPIKDQCARHADYTGAHALFSKLCVRVNTQTNFAAGGDENHFWHPTTNWVKQNVTTLLCTGRGGATCAVQRWHILAGQRHHGWRTAGLHRPTERLGSLVAIARPPHRQIGHGAQARQLFHRLMRGTVLADADRIMREYPQARQFHERTQADRRAHVIGEDQEARAEGAQTAESHAIDHGAHGVLTNSKVHVAAVIGAAKLRRVECARTLQERLVTWGEVGATADHPRDTFHDGVDHLATRRARSVALGISGERCNTSVPTRGQIAAPHGLQFLGALGMRGLIRGPGGIPSRTLGSAASSHCFCKALAHASRHQELRFQRPTIERLGLGNFRLAQWLAVGLGLVLHFRRTPANVAINNDHRWAISGGTRRSERLSQCINIVGILDMLHVPAIAMETRGDIVRA